MIEVKDITKSFGRKQVLKGVSFTANKGEITCLVGINGAGKTTILNAIMNVTPIKRGEILLDGERVKQKSYEKITYIPYTITMITTMRIKNAFEFMRDYYTTWNKQRAQELLTFFKLKRMKKLVIYQKVIKQK